MKQHVAVEELEELNGKSFAKLRDILEMESGITENDFNISHLLNEFYEAVSKEVTIGQMIEILYKYDCDVKIESAGAVWTVEVAGNIRVRAEELVDALWAAVKEIL